MLTDLVDDWMDSKVFLYCRNHVTALLDSVAQISLSLARVDMLRKSYLWGKFVTEVFLLCVYGLCLIRRWVLVPLAVWFQGGSGLHAKVHLGMLGGFLGQFGLLLLLGPWPSGARLSGVCVPDLS